MAINGRGSKSREMNGSELVVGRQPVLEALRQGTASCIYLLEGQKGRIIEEIQEAAAAAGIPLFTEKREVFSRRVMDERGHQGVAALARPFRYLSLAELLEQAGPAPLFLLLDHLQDPQNLGSIIRTVHCAGVEGIIIPKRRAVPVTPAVRKVSAGAAERARIALVGNLVHTLEQLKEAGFWVYGVEVDGEES
nr:TrmH family RNA methyltransferase [Bacillota bacterium]